MHEPDFTCPECGEHLDYDPYGQCCAKCEWWMDQEREECAKYERMMQERREWIEEYGKYGG
jgi:hypothetical protein